ncbi:MAG TPA: ATP-binding protein [Anaerolineaceae bacterium]
MSENLNTREVLTLAFPGIQESVAEEIIQTAQTVHYPAGITLCKEGAIEDTFYIILQGEVRVTKVINDAEERLLKNLHQGDFFGEMAIIHQAPRAATVTTTRPTTVLEIRKDRFSSLLERSTSISMAMIRYVSQRLRENDEMAIEDLREKARQLAIAYQQLADLEQARTQFLSTIAHELRTPLMAANGFLHIIRSGMLRGDALKAGLDTIARNMQDITTLTNDILFLQEMDLILMDFVPVDLGSVVASAVESQRERAGRNKIGINMNIAPNLPPVSGDPHSLERALSAIIDNAIKFSPDGGEVSVEVSHDDHHVHVQIIDHGVGIPAESLPYIFDRFFHLDKIGNHLFRGAGLGLSIAREVIEQHQGEITVTSELGKGSHFKVTLTHLGQSS